MIAVRHSLFAVFFPFCQCCAFAAGTKYEEGDITLQGSDFRYAVFLNAPDAGQQRRIEVRHLEERYEGALAEMSFRDRHLQVFGMVAKLIKSDCHDGVGSLGDMRVSRDPEQDDDPHAIHPQYLIWEYSCK